MVIRFCSLYDGLACRFQKSDVRNQILDKELWLGMVLGNLQRAAQVPIPDKNLIRAYFDNNYGYIKNAVQRDGFEFSYLPTSYRDDVKLVDFTDIRKDLKYLKFNCEFFRENNMTVINISKRGLSFAKEDMSLWFTDEVNLEGNNFTSVLYSEHALRGTSRPIPSWVIEFIRQNNLVLIGTDLESLQRMASSPSDDNDYHDLRFSVKGDNGLFLRISIKIYQYLKDQYGKQPSIYSTTENNLFSIKGDEYSISKFFSLPINSNWSSIKCETDGLHTYVPVNIAGSSYRYLLDTGASFISITKKQARELELIGEGQLLDTYVDLQIADGSFIKAQKMAILELKIGDITLTNILAVISDSGVPLLGMSVLKKFDKWEITNDGSWLRVKKM
jgi:clan AA aspartic protease (TIGR02281 family)